MYTYVHIRTEEYVRQAVSSAATARVDWYFRR